MRLMFRSQFDWQRPPWLVQVAFVMTCSTVSLLITDALDLKRSANFTWVVVLPFLLGILLNDGLRRQILMSAALVAVSLVVVAVLFTSLG